MSRSPPSALTGVPSGAVMLSGGMPWNARKYSAAESSSISEPIPPILPGWGPLPSKIPGRPAAPRGHGVPETGGGTITQASAVRTRCPASLVTAIRSASARHADWQRTAALVADQVRLYLPGPEILARDEREG